MTSRLLASVALLTIGLMAAAAAPIAILGMTLRAVREAWR